MKKIVLLVIACLGVAMVANAQQADTTVKFTSIDHDFGEVKQGVPPTHAFEFTNTGTEPIVIQNVQTSCGCTSPSWTREPIAPGAKGEIKLSYNAAAMGYFHKSATVVTSGTPSPVTLHIKGTVVENKKEAESTGETN